jgi:hypothetical protein
MSFLTPSEVLTIHVQSKVLISHDLGMEFNEEEEEALGMMADLNESAVDAIHSDEYDSAMQYLKRAEEVLLQVLVRVDDPVKRDRH